MLHRLFRRNTPGGARNVPRGVSNLVPEGVKVRTWTDLVNFGVKIALTRAVFWRAQTLTEALVGCVGELTTCSSSLKKNLDEKYFFISEKIDFENFDFRNF